MTLWDNGPYTVYVNTIYTLLIEYGSSRTCIPEILAYIRHTGELVGYLFDF